MTIYGVGLLAACYLAGQLIGEFAGKFLNVNANVGGVGFAMLLLIFLNRWSATKPKLHAGFLNGVVFWDNMYIPIIIAMSATQNARLAMESGMIAVVAGILPVIFLLYLLPVLSRKSEKKNID
jgi:malonate transporter MadL subunit